MTKILLVVGCAALVAACDGAVRMSPLSPTPVVPVATIPPPSTVFQEPYTQVVVGSTFHRKVDPSANPDCIGVPGYGCQYFRITPDRDGTLEVELNWVVETQPGQVLDLSYQSATGELWSDFYPPARGRFTSGVKAGETTQITVWYTFPGVEFTLQTTLWPN